MIIIEKILSTKIPWSVAANEQTDRLVVSDYRRPWTPATLEESQVLPALLWDFGPPILSLSRRNTIKAVFLAVLL